MSNSREIALKILMRIEDGAYSNLILDSELSRHELSDLDKSYITRVIYGVITYKLTLDYIVKKNSKIRLKKISQSILNILRLGIFEIYYMDKIPASATCNEYVKLARKYGHSASSGFVNAILRNLSKKELEANFEGLEGEELLAVKYSCPLWLVEKWLKQFGNIEDLLRSNNEKTDSCIRVNTLKISREELKQKLIDKGYDVSDGRVGDILYIKKLKGLLSEDLFNDGYFVVQDEAPAVIAHLLNPKEGEKILDICSAPGGKTTHVAQLMNDNGEIIATDIHEHRVGLVEQLSEKLGIKSIKTECLDATEYKPEFEEMFDGIVADVPCSGLGVIRKKPEIKWTANEEEIKDLVAIQKAILNNAKRYLKKGGRLVYSTCTITAEENENIVKWFLEENKEFKVRNIEEDIPEELKSTIKPQGWMLFLPNQEKTDGFFACVLEKVQ